ncbi:hypothetical protein [Streptomyces sp. NBC_00690]|uniref:hypothetical protein n=1 Tax=Streptomyces sp. NBC_00690 TaxID=2975808 RepID=UPI002E289D60|nr:hypothetical protein [Streptomyces sp. NBC_00690]
MSVTIKYGQSYQDTQVAFHGPPADVRAQIIDFFGFECQHVTNLTLSELIVEATSIAHGTGDIAGILGGRIVPPEAPADPEGKEDPWNQAQESAPSSGSAWIVAEIERQKSVADLQRLWAANQAAFAEPSVMAAYKAKGRALT